MGELLFVTGNASKVHTLENIMKREQAKVTVAQVNVEVDEIQAETSTEIAVAKARAAYALLQKPLVVDDSSFHISALGGFPGPYIKFMVSTIDIEGILAFMEGKTDRRAYFLSCLVYIDEHGKEYVFEDAPYRGTITDVIHKPTVDNNWGTAWQIFQPEGSDVVLAQLTIEQKLAIDEARYDTDSYVQFARWIRKEV